MYVAVAIETHSRAWMPASIQITGFSCPSFLGAPICAKEIGTIVIFNKNVIHTKSNV